MDYDLFEIHAVGMTKGQRAWRVSLLLALIAIILADMFFWRPA